MGPKCNSMHPYMTKAEVAPERRRTDEDGGKDWSHVATCPGTLGPPEGDEAKNGFSSGASGSQVVLPTSSLQDHEVINSSCFKPLRLW